MTSARVVALDRFRLADVGCPEIDEQHRDIEIAVAKLSDTILRHAPHVEVMADFRDLFELVRHHFTTEEAIYADAKVALLDRHREEHRRLLAALEEVGERLVDGGTETPMRIMLEVADQIAQHVYSYDMIYRAVEPAPVEA